VTSIRPVPNDFEISLADEVWYETVGHPSFGGLRAGGDVGDMLRLFRGGFMPQMGEHVWGRILTGDGELLLAWKGIQPGGEVAYWAGTDQLFGLLVDLRLWGWAEVAFFLMQRDHVFADIPDGVLW
jgi:hypothetical protein